MPKSLEQNYSLQEVIVKSENKDTLDVEVVLSPELNNLSNTLNEVQEAIDKDQDLTASDLLTLKEAVGKIKVEIGGEEFTLEEVKDIENLKENIKIWQEMEAGNFRNTHKLTLLSKKAKKIIANYTGKSLLLNGLISAKDLVFPNSIGGTLNLNGLISAKDLTLPDSIGGDLHLYSLTSAKDLKLPDSIGGYLGLSSLTSAEHLTLPNSIGGDLHLYRLISAKDLTLPNSIGGDLFFGSLSSVEIEELKKRYPQYADKIK